eukprot:1459628-Amphidinium_carterae.1
MRNRLNVLRRALWGKASKAFEKSKAIMYKESQIFRSSLLFACCEDGIVGGLSFPETELERDKKGVQDWSYTSMD